MFREQASILSTLLMFFFVLAGFYIAAAACSYAYNFCLTNAIQNAMFDLRNAIEKKLQKLPVSYFDKHAYGDIFKPYYQ